MKLFDWLLGPARQLPQKKPANFNWFGPLPEKVDWDWAHKNCDLLVEQPKVCPICGGPLELKKFDWLELKDADTGESVGGQHMVIAYVCPHGHGAWVEWA